MSSLSPLHTALLVGLLAGGCEPEDDRRGELCARNADCAGLTCGFRPAELVDLSPAQLACDDPRGADPVGAACADGSTCIHGLCTLAGGCVAPCGADADCADGRCMRMFVRGADATLHPVEACQATSDLPDDAVIETSLVPDALSATGGTLLLPPTETPTLVALRHLGSPEWPGTLCRPPICVESLRSLDDDFVLYDREAQRVPGAPAPVNPVTPLETIAPALIYIGNGSVPPWSESGYAAELASEAPGDVELTTVQRTPAGGRLDLNLFYADGNAWGPEGDRGPPLLAEALERVDEIFEQAGLYIGEVRQLRVRAALLERGDTFEQPDDPGVGFARLRFTFGTWMELPALMRLSAGAGNAAINLFLVDTIEGRSGGGRVVALSAGSPGALGMQGTAASGIAVSTAAIVDGARLGRTLAHEIGHFLGLFHATESDGRRYDPLDDTPDCELSEDLDGDGLLEVGECPAEASDNLMFWANDGGVVLSEEQRRILAQAPLLK